MNHNNTSKIIIGLHKRWYGYAYSVYQDGLENAKYVDVPFIPFRKLKYVPSYLGNIKFFSPFPKVDLFHTINNIVLNKTAWVITYESFLPRFLGDWLNNQKIMQWGLEKLASKYCKKIIAMSYAAQELFYNIIEKNGLSISDFDHKTEVVYNGHNVAYIDRKKINKDQTIVKLVFVGNDFFRKGGRVIVDVFEELVKVYDFLELQIVSRLQFGDYITLSTAKDQEIYEEKIIANPKIKWLKDISYAEVNQKILPNSDIAVMLTFDDCFPNSNVEAMLAGLPVISTNVFSVPEQIEHEANGFLINLPLTEERHIDCFWERDLFRKRERILELEEQMKPEFKRYLIRLIENADVRESFGKKSRELALKKFDYRIRNEKLQRIYQQAIAD